MNSKERTAYYKQILPIVFLAFGLCALSSGAAGAINNSVARCDNAVRFARAQQSIETANSRYYWEDIKKTTAKESPALNPDPFPGGVNNYKGERVKVSYTCKKIVTQDPNPAATTLLALVTGIAQFPALEQSN